MEDVQNVKSRIKTLFREKRMTENKLAAGDQNLQKRLNNQISHDGILTVETLLFIVGQFPDVSCDWLLRGRRLDTGDADAVRALVDQLSEKDKQINHLLEIIAQRRLR